MPEGLIAALIAGVLGITGATLKRFGEVEKRIDRLELSVATGYVNKADFERYSDRIYGAIDRFESKLDQHMQEETLISRDMLAALQTHIKGG